MKWRFLVVAALVAFLLLPFYFLHKRLQGIMRPRDSFRNFLVYLVTVLFLVFAYTFLLVWVIQLIFPPS